MDIYTEPDPYTVSIFLKTSQTSTPLDKVFCISSNSDLCFTWVIEVLSRIPCYIGSCYNGCRFYQLTNYYPLKVFHSWSLMEHNHDIITYDGKRSVHGYENINALQLRPFNDPVNWMYECVFLNTLNGMFINSFPTSAAYIRQWTGSSLDQVLACRLFGTKPLPEPIQTFCRLDSCKQISVKYKLELFFFIIIFIQENAFKSVVCQNGGHFVQGEVS